MIAFVRGYGILLIGIFTILICPVHAQLDSLIELASTASKVEERIDALYAVAWKLKKKDLDKAIKFAEGALVLALENNFEQKASASYNCLGIIYKYRGDYDLSLENHKKALTIRQALKDSIGIGRSLNNMGTLYTRKGDLVTSFKFLLEALAIREQLGVPKELLSSYTNLSINLSAQGKYQDALFYQQYGIPLLEARIEQFEATDNEQALNSAKISLAKNFFNIANNYAELEKFPEALVYLEKCFPIYDTLGYDYGKTLYFNSLGNIYENLKAYDRAETAFSKCLTSARKQEQWFEAAAALTNLGISQHRQKQYPKAIEYYQESLKISKEIEALPQVYQNQLNLAISYAALGQFNLAYEFHVQGSDLKDSLFNEEKNLQLVEMQTQYETVKKEQTILKQKNEITIQGLESKRNKIQRNTLLVFLILVISLLVFSIYFYQQRQRVTRLLTQQSKQLYQQEIEGLLKHQELNSINSMLEGQEIERKRIAEDLHDRLGSLLATVKWNYDHLFENIKLTSEKDREQLAKNTELLDKAYGTVRDVAHNMVSGVLVSFGLMPALNELATSIRASGKLKIEVFSHGLDQRLDSSQEIILYRIIQELISNVLKHAQATQVTIQISRIQDELTISVEDDGIGFDAQHKPLKHMGLKNIEARIQKLNGSLNIDSGKGAGTTIIIEVPLYS